MSKRKQYKSNFKARLAPEALTGEQMIAELVSRFGVHPTMIHHWKRALLDGACDIFERSGRSRSLEITEETVKELHAKIGELAVANDFLSRRLKPWTGK